MAKSLVAVFVLLCTLSGILTCPQLQACTTNLTNITTDISALIPFCLNIVSKDGTLQACEQKAQRDCNLSGHEASYKTFRQEKNKARQECLRDCPEMNQVKTCFGLIQYDIIQTSGYSEFCRQYQNITTTCVDTKLSNCTFRKQLFESGLSSDGKRIVQNICNSGCVSIDETINSIQSCNKQFPIKAVDSRIDCQSYQKYKNCIQKLSPCSQFLVVAEYFTQNVTTAMTKCEQTTTSTAATTLTTTIKETMRSTERKIVTSHMSSTVKTTDREMKTSTVSKSESRTTSVTHSSSTTSASVKKQNIGSNESTLTSILTTSDVKPFGNQSSQTSFPPSIVPIIDKTTNLPKKALQNDFDFTMTTMAVSHSDKQTSELIVTKPPQLTKYTTSASVKKQNLDSKENTSTNILTTSDDKNFENRSMQTSFTPSQVSVNVSTTKSAKKVPQYNFGSVLVMPSGIVLFCVGVVSWCFG